MNEKEETNSTDETEIKTETAEDKTETVATETPTESKTEKKRGWKFWTGIFVDIACIAVFIATAAIGLIGKKDTAALLITSLVAISILVINTCVPLAIKFFKKKSVKYKICGAVMIAIACGFLALSGFMGSVIPSYVQASERYDATTEKWLNTRTEDINYEEFHDEWLSASKELNDIQIKLLWSRVAFYSLIIALGVFQAVSASLNEPKQKTPENQNSTLL